MNEYGFLVGPYFLGFGIIATALALIAIWSGRKMFVRFGAVMLYLLVVYLAFVAVDDLLSRPKPVTFAELQAQLPEGHQGHLVLYGEATTEGIYLLLRSPAYAEPRYYLMQANAKTKGNFGKAQQESRKKGTQLLLGGKKKSGEGDGEGGKGKKGKDKGKKGDRNGEGNGEEDVEMEFVFHPAPVSGGVEKDGRDPGPVSIPTPANPDPNEF